MGFKMTAIEHLGTIASATKAGLLSNGQKDKDVVIKILQKVRPHRVVVVSVFV